MIKTLLRYPGGKSKAIDLITPYVKDYNKIISHEILIVKRNI